MTDRLGGIEMKDGQAKIHLLLHSLCLILALVCVFLSADRIVKILWLLCAILYMISIILDIRNLCKNKKDE